MAIIEPKINFTKNSLTTKKLSIIFNENSFELPMPIFLVKRKFSMHWQLKKNILFIAFNYQITSITPHTATHTRIHLYINVIFQFRSHKKYFQNPLCTRSLLPVLNVHFIFCARFKKKNTTAIWLTL